MLEEETELLRSESPSRPSDEQSHSTAVNGHRGSTLKAICSWSVLRVLFLGQLVSLLLCGTAVTSGILQQDGVHIPTAQCFLNYFLLCIVYTTSLGWRKQGRSLIECLKTWWWKYILIAIVDVEGNYLMVKAYKYTTVTSVQMLDCISIPTVMILSCVVLRVQYKVLHISGAVVCLIGLGGLILADVLTGKNDAALASNRVLGDVLCILGATLYGISNVSQEFVVRRYDRVEFLGMVGIFGSFINGIQFVILEREEVTSVDFSSFKIVLLLLGFAICLFLLYSLMPVVIEQSSALAVNLSILSADFYTLLFGIFFFKYQFHYLYFLSFGVIILGLCIYSVKKTAERTITSTSKPTESNYDSPVNS
ncbi:hypothetical protein ScPMuIL_011803 [Solemya velum]